MKKTLREKFLAKRYEFILYISNDKNIAKSPELYFLVIVFAWIALM